MRARAPLSAVAAIGGFGIGVALLSVATTAAIVLVAPEPDDARASIADAAAALAGDPRGFTRTLGAEPVGRRAYIFETVLADRLRRPAADVRLVMTGPPTARGAAPVRVGRAGTVQPPVLVMERRTATPNGAAPPIPPGATVTRTVTRQRRVYRSDDFRLLSPGEMPSPWLRAGLAAVPINAFVASVRQADGRWLTVTPYRPWLSGWRLRVLAAILVSLLLIMPLAWAFARRLTRPFRTLARAVDAGHAEVPVEGPRELREAAAAIVAMRARLADETAERLRMLTAVAHDLRTPLTGLRLRIEGVDEPARGRMIADVERMGAMIAEVLAFARGAHRPRTRVAVGPLIAEVAGAMDAGRAIVAVEGAAEEAAVMAEAPTLRRAVENLVRNAIDYAGGGLVSVTRAGDAVEIAVRDRGPGIPAADRARLILPFERGEASRNRDTGGAGLGLSIVADFAAAHGGTLELDAADGGGLVARLRLPADQKVARTPSA